MPQEDKMSILKENKKKWYTYRSNLFTFFNSYFQRNFKFQLKSLSNQDSYPIFLIPHSLHQIQSLFQTIASYSSNAHLIHVQLEFCHIQDDRKHNSFLKINNDNLLVHLAVCLEQPQTRGIIPAF